jgi:hypothetical protein
MAAVIYTAIYVGALAGIAVGYWAAAAFIDKYRNGENSGANSEQNGPDGHPPKKKGLFGFALKAKSAGLDTRLNSHGRGVSMAEFESDMSGLSEAEIIERRQKIEDRQYAVLKNFVKAAESEDMPQIGQPEAESAGTA